MSILLAILPRMFHLNSHKMSNYYFKINKVTILFVMLINSTNIAGEGTWSMRSLCKSRFTTHASSALLPARNSGIYRSHSIVTHRYHRRHCHSIILDVVFWPTRVPIHQIPILFAVTNYRFQLRWSDIRHVLLYSFTFTSAVYSTYFIAIILCVSCKIWCLIK